MKSIFFYVFFFFSLGFLSCGGDSSEVAATAASTTETAAPASPSNDREAFQSEVMPGALEGLTLGSTNKLSGGISWINGQKAIPEGVNTVAKGPANIQGWAIDPAVQALCSKVFLLVDGVPYSTLYGQNRPDVAAAYNKPKYAQSGFYAKLLRKDFSPGQHLIELVAVSRDGDVYYKVGQPFQISF